MGALGSGFERDVEGSYGEKAAFLIVFCWILAFEAVSEASRSYNASMNKGRGQKYNRLSEHEKNELRSRSNMRISQCCNYAALVIMVVAIASFVLERSDTFFVQFGTMVAVALLAIAAINNPARK